MNKEDYQKYVEEKSPKSPIFLNCIKAFLVGGLICAIGQVIFYFSKSRGLEETLSYTVVSISLIFLRSRKSYPNHWFC